MPTGTNKESKSDIILIIVWRLRGLFTASCTEGSFAGHSSLYCGDSLALSVLVCVQVAVGEA